MAESADDSEPDDVVVLADRRDALLAIASAIAAAALGVFMAWSEITGREFTGRGRRAALGHAIGSEGRLVLGTLMIVMGLVALRAAIRIVPPRPIVWTTGRQLNVRTLLRTRRFTADEIVNIEAKGRDVGQWHTVMRWRLTIHTRSGRCSTGLTRLSRGDWIERSNELRDWKYAWWRRGRIPSPD